VIDTQLNFYITQTRMSDPGKWSSLFPGPQTSIPEIVKAVQGSMLHIFWAERYGVTLSEERQSEVLIRPVNRKLTRLQEIEPGPLAQNRRPENRLVGNCRDFTLMSVSLLRALGIPARSRCGFATYFMPGHFEDHWVVEYWQADSGRWVMLDTQMDDLQSEVLHLDFDPSNMPAGRFVCGGEAWQMARTGLANPDDFGIFEWKGMDFIKGNLLRDLLALVQFEVLPWDSWGIVETPYSQLSPKEIDLLDHAARIDVQAEMNLVQDLIDKNPNFLAPGEWAE
jgi:hypothetical protein